MLPDLLLVGVAAVAWLAMVAVYGRLFRARWTEILAGLPGTDH